jgi:protein SCO1/2
VRADLLDALSRLGSGRAYNLVVMSIDPTETAADAASAKATDVAQFASANNAEHREYLTGSAAAIQAVSDAVGLRSRFDAQAKQFLHPAGLVFLTGSGTVSSYLLGLGYKPGDVGLGLTRAANEVTARALPVLLLCFHYDPKTGRYSLAVWRLVQLGCVITVLVVGGVIYLALRRERRVP